VLQKLLDLLKNSPHRLTQEQLCDQLGVTPAGLQSLFDILVRKGRLIEFNEQACPTICRDCPVMQVCAKTPAPQEHLYKIS
jgi:hypothetical protein